MSQTTRNWTRAKSYRHVVRHPGNCPCGGLTFKILRKHPMQVCSHCGVGRIGDEFIAKEDVPKVLAGTLKVTDK